MSILGNSLTLAAAWTAGAFVFLPVWVFVRGKTSERTLSVSPESISTQIGSTTWQVPWNKIAEVTDSRDQVIIVAKTGNAFFIPGRAFTGQEHRSQFLQQIAEARAQH